MTFARPWIFLVLFVTSSTVVAADRESTVRKPVCWNVDDLRPGMTGYGLTVMRGVKLERFNVQIIGTMKNMSPGRDAVLARFSGLDLEKTGVIAGMSGSPVYIDDKLLGAVDVTWDFTKEPIGGITPFSQMVEFGQPSKTRGKDSSVAASYLIDEPRPSIVDGLGDAGFSRVRIPASGSVPSGMEPGFLVPLMTPLATSGVSPSALRELSRELAPLGMVPVQAGAVGSDVETQFAKTTIVPGGAMAVGLVTGDVSVTAIGTVTSVAENRVFGFGHPLIGLGSCELPMMTAFIHVVLPKQSISTKMGAPLKMVGRIDSDSSTGIAGFMGGSADMIPITIAIRNRATEVSRQFRCRIAREPQLIGPLSMMALGSCTDMEGNAPNELTTRVVAKVEMEGQQPLILNDSFSGGLYGGPQGLLRSFSSVSNMLSILLTNPYQRPRIKSVTCEAEMLDRRLSARILNARALHPVLEAGETLKVLVELEPYRPETKSNPTAPLLRELPLELRLPKDLPPGKYSVSIGDAFTDLREEIRGRPHVTSPNNFEQLHRLLSLQLKLKRTDVVLRFALPNEQGVAIDGSEFPDLPASVSDILARDLSSRVTPMQSSLVVRQATPWSIEGSQMLRFEVVKNKDFYPVSAKEGNRE